MFSTHFINCYIGRNGKKEVFYLTTHSSHFIYGYMVSDIYERTTQIGREETCCATTWATLSD